MVEGGGRGAHVTPRAGRVGGGYLSAAAVPLGETLGRDAALCWSESGKDDVAEVIWTERTGNALKEKCPPLS